MRSASSEPADQRSSALKSPQFQRSAIEGFAWLSAACAHRSVIAAFVAFALVAGVMAGGPGGAAAQPSLMEALGRGVVAIRASAADVSVSWRVLGTDPADVSFNLYRSTAGGALVPLNGAPLTGATHHVDSSADLTRSNTYVVRAIVNGLEQPAGPGFTLPANAPVQPYLRVPLQVPPGGTTPAGEAYTYSPNDTSVGDLDGDGEYELVVKWDPSNAKDNSQSGYTGPVYLDAYEIDGTRLWRIDLGRNIRAGAHYTQFIVFDLDGDGKAEVACKTADGTIDGAGTTIGNASADWRNTSGYVLAGPEFLTVFNGQTGAALATASYVVPRGTVSDWGDDYGNRVDRFLAGVAYLDGQRPSLVMARGYYTRAVLAAWDWRDGQLTNRWTFDTGHTGTTSPWAGYRGQGNHNLSVGDVDGDGRDEIVYGAAAIDDDGDGLYTTGWGHGDALHLSDMDPARPGLEAFQPHEAPGSYGPNGLEFRDARTGALIFGVQASGDIGRGLALDVDPRYPGYEMWGSGPTGGMYTASLLTPNAVLGPRGVQIAATRPSINFGIWWDGDPLRELLDGTTISKWDWMAGSASALLSPAGVASNNGTKATPALSADILGDWREEVIWRESGNNALRIYVTTLPTTMRLYTLMHDRQYRTAIGWQNVGYNQPPHPGFFLGDGMAAPPPPNIVTSLSVLLGPPAPTFSAIADDTGVSDHDFITRDPTLTIGGSATPGTTVAVTRSGVGAIGTTTVDGSGNWTLDYTGTTLPEGISTFTATATDGQGRTGAPSPPFAIRVDTTIPAAPAIESIAAEGALVLRGLAEAASTVAVDLASSGAIGTAVADAGGRWTLTYAGPALPAGVHTFSAAATDVAGNTSAASAPATVDTAIVTPTILTISNDSGPSASDGVTSDPTLVLSGTAAAGHTVSLSRTGPGSGGAPPIGAVPIGTVIADASGQWSFDYSGTTLADGAYAFRAAASPGSAPGAGTSPASPAFPVVVDTVAPIVLSVNRENPTAASSSAAAITFRVTFSEPASGLDAPDFTAVFTDGLAGSIADVSASAGLIVDVTVGPLTGEGSVRLDVGAAGTGITDTAGHGLAGGFTTGQTYTRLLTGNGTWIRDTTDGLWSDHDNWQDGIVGSGNGTTVSFDALELVEDVTVHLDAPRTVGNLVFGDTDVTSGASWIVDGGGSESNVLTLAAASGSPTITVSPLGAGASATIAAPLAGTAGFTKLGTGTLALTSANAIAGGLNVNAGTLRLDAGASLGTGAGTVNVSVTAGVQFLVQGGTFTAEGLATMGGGGNPGIFALEAGSATFGAVRTNSDFGSTVRVSGGTFSAADVNIRRNSAAAPDFASGFLVSGGIATVGTIGLGTANSNGAMSISGGSLTATGAVTIGNQATGGRGGAMRVLGGTFTASDTVSGVVLARTNGANTNNVASATFTGGVSQIEKLTLGFDASVIGGSATVTLNGGTLYLGAGGIVKNGAGAFATTLNFSSGTLGARADWSTPVPLTLSTDATGATLAIKAADAADAPHAIGLGGALSGTGGFIKTGGGTLALAGVSTFSGPVGIDAGMLQVNGSIGAGAPLAVNGMGVLGGTGTIARDVVLHNSGTIVPGSTQPGSSLSVNALTWHGGGRLGVDLAAGTRLVVAGALTRGTGAGFDVALAASAPLTVGTLYTIATFGSTDFAVSQLTYSGLSGYTGLFVLGATQVQFLVTGAGPTAAYTHWTQLMGLPQDRRGPADDPDFDGVPNLLEFVEGLDPLRADGERTTTMTIEVDGERYAALRFVRRQDIGGVTVGVLASADLRFTTPIAVVEVSASDRGDGLEDVIVRSVAPLSQQPRQFFRLAATLPDTAAESQPTAAQAVTVESGPVGVMTTELTRGESGIAVPLIAEDLFVGVAESNGTSRIVFPAVHGPIGPVLGSDRQYYVEIVTGPLQGERFDVDEQATAAAAGSTVVLALGANSFSTRPSLVTDFLVGARCVIRPHVTLNALQGMLMPGLVGHENPARADGVWLFEGGDLAFYYLRGDGLRWSRLGSTQDRSRTVIPPDISVVVDIKSRPQAWLSTGRVRLNPFRKNLVAGLQAFASGFPVDLSPAQIDAFVDRTTPPAIRWTGSNIILLADQIHLLFRPGRLLEVFYLRGDGSTWRSLTSPTNVADSPILGATGMVVIRRIRSDASYAVPRPF